MILEFATIDSPPPRDLQPVYIARAEYQTDPDNPSVVTLDVEKAMPGMAPIGHAMPVDTAGVRVAVQLDAVVVNVKRARNRRRRAARRYA